MLPFVFLFCQVLTFVVYEGRWRALCLLPLPLALAACAPLIYVQTPVAFVLVTIGAPVVGMVALACVWAAFSHSTRATDGAVGDDVGG